MHVNKIESRGRKPTRVSIRLQRLLYRFSVRLAVFELDSRPSLLHSCRSMSRQSQLPSRNTSEQQC